MTSYPYVGCGSSSLIKHALRAPAGAGLVRMDRQRIVLRDREGLETEAQR